MDLNSSFQTAHRELCKTLDLTVEDAGMHHANMVRDAVAGTQEVLQQDQAPTDNPKIISEPVDHVENVM